MSLEYGQSAYPEITIQSQCEQMETALREEDFFDFLRQQSRREFSEELKDVAMKTATLGLVAIVAFKFGPHLIDHFYSQFNNSFLA